jgi:V/A-type H+-transporting ATPase subunit I
MITPVKKLSVITLTDNEPLLLEEIGKLGVVQLRKLDETEFIGFNNIVVEEIREYESLSERFRTLYNKFEVGKTEDQINQKSLTKEKISVEDLEEKIKRYEQKVADIENQLRESQDWLEELKEAKPILKILKEQKVNPEDLGDFKNIFARAGVVSKKVIPKLERIVNGREDVTYRSSNISEKESFLYISALVEVKFWIDKALSSIGFKEFKLPEKTPAKINDAMKWIDDENKKTKKRVGELKQNWAELKLDCLKDTTNLKDSLYYSLSISNAGSNLLRSKMMSVFQGWVPQDRISDLDGFFKNLKKKTNEQLMVWYEDPAPDESVPTIMKNPRLFRAYEVLTRQYGQPDARELDPTPLSTILWVVMFGMMFPDFGQGAVILGLGILFAYVWKKEMMSMNFVKIGKLFIGLGISAIFFGLLTGSFFLIEITPLWPGLQNPWIENPTNVIWVIKIAVFFGIAQIITGLTISIYNHLKNGDNIEALMGEHGVAGLVTFIGIVILAFQFLGISVYPGIRFPRLELGALTHWTIIIPLVGILAIILRPIIAKEDITMGLGMLLETLISFFGNILSYARIAGFAIAHAALALVSHNLLIVNPILGIGLGLIFLNFFALSLELLVSMIQALRLLYYEFSTKFYKGTGTAYAPYKI